MNVVATQVGDAIVLRIEVGQAPAAPDELVAFPWGLEEKAAKSLIRTGRLPSVRLGRKTYCRRSDLVALVSKPAVAAKGDVYGDVVAKLRGGS